MADAQEQYDELAAEWLRQPGVSLGRSLRNETLTVHGKIFAFLKDERLVVKLPAARAAALLADGTAAPFESGGRRMKEWVAVPAAADPARRRELMGEANGYVSAGAAR
jgi:hypothetical protein